MQIHQCDLPGCAQPVTTKPGPSGILGAGQTANIGGIALEACCLAHFRQVVDAHLDTLADPTEVVESPTDTPAEPA